MNNVQQREIKDISVCLRPTAPPERDTTLCAYVNIVNTLPEIQHWIAYYDVMSIDKIVLYYSSIDRYLRQSIIQSQLWKKVEMVDWVFPQNILENG